MSEIIATKLSRRMKDLTGKKFGRLLVTSFSHVGEKHGSAYWLCLCDCGKTVVRRADGLQNRRQEFKSCGCWKGPKPKPPEILFWDCVKKDCANGCWEWQGYRNDNGYGVLNFDSAHHFTHRFSWEITHGEIPEELCVLHRCDNPPCVNPAHLFLGTRVDNAHDRHSKGRTLSGDKHHSAKVKDEQILEAFIEVNSGKKSLKTAAEELGIKPSTLCGIFKGKTRRHLNLKGTKCERFSS